MPISSIMVLYAIGAIGLILIILFIVVVYSIIKTQTNTRILTEQNKQIIAQNNAILAELQGIKAEQINTSQNEIKYMEFMTRTK